MAKRKMMRLPNGFGSITFKKGARRKPFMATTKTEGYNEKGHPIRKTLGFFETWQQAYECLLEYNKTPYNIDLRKITFSEIYERFVDRKEKSPKGLGLSNKRVLACSYRRCTEFYDIPIVDIKKVHLQDFLNSLVDTLSYESLVKQRSMLCQVWDEAIAMDVLDKNYARMTSIEKEDDAEHSNALTVEQVDILWKNVDKVEGADAVLVMCYTGHRTSEYTKVSVDMETLTISGGIKTKTGRERIVPIHSRIVPLVEKLLNEHRLFGSPYAWIYRNFYRVMTECSIDISDHTPYDTRATFVSHLTSAHVPDLHIKRMIGHKSKDITKDAYTSVPLEELRESIEKLR